MKLQINIPTPDEVSHSLFIYEYGIVKSNDSKKILQLLNNMNKKGCVFCNGHHLFLTSSAIIGSPTVVHMNCEDCGFMHEFNLKTLLDKSKDLLTPEDKKKSS